MITVKEALENLLVDRVDFIVEEIESQEEYMEEIEEEQFAKEMHESRKRELENWLVLVGAVDETLNSLDAIKNRIKEIKRVRGIEDKDEEVSEVETELYTLLTPWYKKAKKENGGYATDFELDEEENRVLAKINLEQGSSRRLITEPDEEIEASEDDTFTFYPWQGEVCVVFNGYADGSFASYPEEFQKKALEIIKTKLEKGD